MTVGDLLYVCGNDLKIKVRVTKERKVRYNIIENRADIAYASLSNEIKSKEVYNVYVDNALGKGELLLYKPILIINIEE
jgi:hypothetical protein